MKNSNSKNKTYVLNFINAKKPSVQITGKTFAKALEAYVKVHKDLQYADLKYAELHDACLQNVDLQGANLQCADLKLAELQGANLQNTCLQFANLYGADLQRVNLQDANLQDANLEVADLQFANLQNANMKYAILQNTCLQNPNLQGADLDFSTLPLWIGSLNMKIDKRLFCQLLYHTVQAGQSVEDTEVKALLNFDEVLNLVNQFHRIDEFGKIEKK